MKNSPNHFISDATNMEEQLASEPHDIEYPPNEQMRATSPIMEEPSMDSKGEEN